MNIVFNADTGGAGDAILMSWLAEGYKQAGHTCSFFANNPQYVMLLRVLGQTVASGEPTGIPLGSRFPPYHVELAIDRGANARTVVWAQGLPENPAAVRPRVNIARGLRMKAAKTQLELAGDKPIVGIFPLANYTTRTWPLSYWVDLAMALQRDGATVWAFLPGHKKSLLPKGIYRWWGQSWDMVSALLERCSVVIGNDSAGPHLSGTLGRKTFAIMGPSSNIFTHIPEVTEVHVTKQQMSCVSCHFAQEKGFRPACQSSCQALLAYTPSDLWPHVQGALDAARTRV